MGSDSQYFCYPNKKFSFSFEGLKRGQGLRLIPIQVQVLIFVINPSKQF